jgi:endonuclease III
MKKDDTKRDRKKGAAENEINKMQTYSEELGIKLSSGKESEIFKWFLASILFGHRISENIAKRTYREFEKANVLTQDAILSTGWDGLVEILDRGGFVRYDFSTADRLLDNARMLKEKYGGKLTNLHASATSPRNLEQRLQEFLGIGPITTNIFLRELRTVWKNADPEPLSCVKSLAKNLKLHLPSNRKTISFIRREAYLIRNRHSLKP